MRGVEEEGTHGAVSLQTYSANMAHLTYVSIKVTLPVPAFSGTTVYVRQVYEWMQNDWVQHVFGCICRNDYQAVLWVLSLHLPSLLLQPVCPSSCLVVPLLIPEQHQRQKRRPQSSFQRKSNLKVTMACSIARLTTCSPRVLGRSATTAIFVPARSSRDRVFYSHRNICDISTPSRISQTQSKVQSQVPLNDPVPKVIPEKEIPSEAASPQIAAKPPKPPQVIKPKPRLRATKAALSLVSLDGYTYPIQYKSDNNFA